jgi:hypothetical protein
MCLSVPCFNKGKGKVVPVCDQVPCHKDYSVKYHTMKMMEQKYSSIHS